MIAIIALFCLCFAVTITLSLCISAKRADDAASRFGGGR